MAELVDAADSVWVRRGETRGEYGVKFGEPLTGNADGNPELSSVNGTGLWAEKV